MLGVRGLVGPIIGLIVGLGIILMAGCATPGVGGGHRPSAETQKVILQQVLGLVVDHFVAESPRARERVERVREVAVRLSLVTGVTTIDDLRAAVDSEVAKLNLTSLEQKDAQRFLEILEAVLRDYVGQEKLDAQGLVKVNDFVQWVIAAWPPPAALPE